MAVGLGYHRLLTHRAFDTYMPIKVALGIVGKRWHPKAETVGAIGAGAYPALARNPKLATTGYPVFLVIHGRKGMPPFGKLLTDQQVAAVVNYIRTHFGNDFPGAVTDDDARAAR